MLIKNFRALSTIQFSSYNYYFGNYKCISLLLLPPLEHTTIKFTFLKYNFQQVVVMLVDQSCPTLCDPMDCSPLQLIRSSFGGHLGRFYLLTIMNNIAVNVYIQVFV